jgi:hypothetical protein
MGRGGQGLRGREVVIVFGPDFARVFFACARNHPTFHSLFFPPSPPLLPLSLPSQEEGEEGKFTPLDPRLLQRSRPMMRKNDALLLPSPSSSLSPPSPGNGKEGGREGGEAGTGGSSSGGMATAL